MVQSSGRFFLYAWVISFLSVASKLTPRVIKLRRMQKKVRSFISFISSTINSLFLNFCTIWVDPEILEHHKLFKRNRPISRNSAAHYLNHHIRQRLNSFDYQCRTSARSSSRRAIGGREREKKSLMWLHHRIHPYLSPGLAIGGKPKRRTGNLLVDDDNNWRKQREREHISTMAAMAALAMWQWAGRQTVVANCKPNVMYFEMKPTRDKWH